MAGANEISANAVVFPLSHKKTIYNTRVVRSKRKRKLKERKLPIYFVPFIMYFIYDVLLKSQEEERAPPSVNIMEYNYSNNI